jgi:hypothetical protein
LSIKVYIIGQGIASKIIGGLL